MLSNVKLKTEAPLGVQLLEAIFEYTREIENPQPGIYLNAGANFNYLIDEDSLINEHPDFWPIPDYDPTWDRNSTADERLKFFAEQLKNNTWYQAYGVADNLTQVLKYFRKYVSDQDHHFCIAITRINKATHPQWRWHKWGKYIGKQKPQCEHLGDEPKIESVILYHIHQIKPIDFPQEV